MVRSPERGDGHDDYDGYDNEDRAMSPVDRETDTKSSSSSSKPAGMSDEDWKNRGNSLHVAGFSLKLKDEELKDKFTSFGKILECVVMVDPNTKISRGFGFITFGSADEADEAIRIMDGSKIDGNVIKVSKSKRSKPRDSTPGEYMGSDRRKRMAPRPYNPYPYPYPTKYPPYPPPYGGVGGYYGYGSYPYQYPTATTGYGGGGGGGSGKSSYDQGRYSPYMRVDSSSRYDRSTRDYDRSDRDRSDRDRDRGSDRDRSDRDRDRDHTRGRYD
ncbi:RNA-binding region RNP-1 domain-containing protein [Heterostelium album PN500]|uniref:RNA-binding region RNP-1 domain-containing protein n=1 Tax=Heterostelium pallidum (strain ATCC 26659 / Pp 5 / PN500) TaxID=670386 RepID=D3BFX1_HETP5|nr:RNA-binding region RNP-1 domain-containing protein [Heterostelium album PN500]EFA79731.1 RNA-binding region RNP-1 domain-containing protein [Heterostelium album PN500]|eukprot:XP_020431852.1 RNA-binding region RNP-1 domain-containing protein [Heterostelium album PN500]